METVRSPAEHKIILHNTSWETYERLMEERGENRVPRFAYDRGELEIVSPSTEHKSIAYYIGLLVAVFAEETDADLHGAGSTTFGREDLERGFEPDACFYVQNAACVRGKPRIDLGVDPPPDLVVEVDITSLSRQIPDLRPDRHPGDLAPRRREDRHPRTRRRGLPGSREERCLAVSHQRGSYALRQGEPDAGTWSLDTPGARVGAGATRLKRVQSPRRTR